MKQGDVYWYAFRAPDKRRPVLILTRNSALSYLTSETVAQISTTIDHPVKEKIQKDGRIRRWAQIAEMGGKYLRVILLPDGQI